MSYMRGSGPAFLDQSGRQITSAPCGSIYTFSVPGYSQVWLTQTKDGTIVFDAPFSVPMPQYQSGCATDPGVYVSRVYQTDGVQKGALIGATTITITPTPVIQNAPSGGRLIVPATTANASTSWGVYAGIAAIVAVGYSLLSGRRKAA